MRLPTNETILPEAKYRKRKDIVEKETPQLLTTINVPADLRALMVKDLPQVCDELRQTIIHELANNPGHFASSLGTVELTVALHYVFNTPKDRIVWDVGHQAAGHKILTGRREQFSTYRHLNGLRPFPSPQESEYDTFACGHASNSISAALGMATAAHQKKEDYHVVAVIGDGSMSGGLAFEGLNNASETPNNLLIILNDNNMSIDGSVGGMKSYLHTMHTSTTYNTVRDRISKRLSKWGLLTDKRRKRILRFNNSLKSFLVNQQNIFEGMDIRYFGPIDGNDVTELVRTLQQIRDMKGPKLLHLKTVKGKGFVAAEENPTVYHAPGAFDPETGERIMKKDANCAPRYQDVFGNTLIELAKSNKAIVGVTPAMATGCGMAKMMHEMPERTFDVGIAEGHAVTFSAGMARDGMIPFCNIYSSFSQRAYDNIIHDVALNSYHVVFCLDRAGLVGEDGPTHHGQFDLAALRPIPNLTIASPLNENELRHLMFTAAQPDNGPFVIRYPRGKGEGTDCSEPLHALPIGKGQLLHEGEGTAVLSLGPIGNRVAEVVAELEQEGTHIAHYDMRFLKPIDEEILEHVGRNFKRIVTIEDGARKGGLGSAVLEYMADHDLHPTIVRMGLPDEFVQHGKPDELYRIVGLDKESIRLKLK